MARFFHVLGFLVAPCCTLMPRSGALQVQLHPRGHGHSAPMPAIHPRGTRLTIVHHHAAAFLRGDAHAKEESHQGGPVDNAEGLCAPQRHQGGDGCAGSMHKTGVSGVESTGNTHTPSPLDWPFCCCAARAISAATRDRPAYVGARWGSW